MAISPRVQGFQNQMVGAQQVGATSQETAFARKFGELAFTTFGSKYPVLQEQVITFKVLDQNLEDGTATGAFLLNGGDKIYYVPVILSSGAIVSCEMVFSKEDGQFRPLVSAEVAELGDSATNNLPVIPSSVPVVEDTTKLFREMYRPPQGSKLVVAGDVSLQNLPNGAKQALSEFLERNAELLAKVAAFYPVELLASKLAKTQTDTAQARGHSPVEVLRLDTITKEAAASLTKEDKVVLRQRGYLVHSNKMAPKVLGLHKLAESPETSLEVIQKNDDTPLWGTGELLRVSGLDLVPERCVVAGKSVYTKQGKIQEGYLNSGGVILHRYKDGISKSDLEYLGAALPVDCAVSKPSGNPTDDSRDCSCQPASIEEKTLAVFYPTRSGSYKEASSEEGYDFPNLQRGSVAKSNIDGDVFIRTTQEWDRGSVGFIRNMERGYVSTGERTYVFPLTSYCLFTETDRGEYVRSLSGLRKLMLSGGIRLRLVKDGVDFRLLDSTQVKTARFQDEAELAGHLAETYGLGDTERACLFDEQDILVLQKKAFSQEELMGQIPYGYGATEQSITPSATGAYEVDPEALQASMELQDPDMFDLGMITSLSGNDGVIELLVDQFPRFSETTSDLGRTLLALCINKKEVEEYYGSDQYEGLLGNLRKVFRTLGEMVHRLKLFVHMQRK